jgi:transposase
VVLNIRAAYQAWFADEGTGLMTGKRKRYSAEFGAKVAMEALRGEPTRSQSATKHGLRRTMAADWKRQAMEGC